VGDQFNGAGMLRHSPPGMARCGHCRSLQVLPLLLLLLHARSRREESLHPGNAVTPGGDVQAVYVGAPAAGMGQPASCRLCAVPIAKQLPTTEPAMTPPS
jgi:hypothetical protein